MFPAFLGKVRKETLSVCSLRRPLRRSRASSPEGRAKV